MNEIPVPAWWQAVLEGPILDLVHEIAVIRSEVGTLYAASAVNAEHLSQLENGQWEEGSMVGGANALTCYSPETASSWSTYLRGRIREEGLEAGTLLLMLEMGQISLSERQDELFALLQNPL